ncbi:toll/interleukin-1 receptor domain-containing protein [Pseudosulfitobacter pseudonitzschiae]|uniref:toll/interleukin-1 receptor domain-containing protein n=1 Tax=Pseudosulfitobacter pseudonitzschiae TaxID=1402135 RepID=UPI001AFAB575|nr:toll/interleukin-1 receptor domain-containing protein [Pseudosulfitobacter pseudonitzschiae]MBM1817853.1 toll/interleukin-1 receptor domain-containing protein [Pseudosulfitobacter pseudonitzschiae]MBM1834910.1 toll/interleukin-1 receptor domain-containing protein [Pseudosulfitobacter pseudonitzschiae]MBM1839711.1 toll/interleukin-1 receptor domain-containing protein [Pseudosulfitobacter pseudonitzschiae]MBM1844626.1 toll/interleukin-1 receptor domain-containing protein [Pseudosulfitobacter p
MALYEILIIGSPRVGQTDALTKQLTDVAAAFSLAFPEELAIRTAADLSNRNPKAATVALYFGGDPTVDVNVVDQLEAAKIPIVPVVEKGASVTEAVPTEIALTNACLVDADDATLEALASVALEVLGLLHRQRRIFISYRRSDSREAALQLHDELSSRGFDVFLDTHDFRPAAAFQEMLWHRLSDCDVTIMLDTKDYFGSKWTAQELGRSQALGIQILRVIWPDHSGSRHLSLSDTVTLSNADLDGSNRLRPDLLVTIAKRAEALRSRSIATRHLDLVGRLKTEVMRIGGQFEGIGAYRSVSLTLPGGRALEAYPMVGVPTAEMLNDIQEKAGKAGHGRFPCLVYNHIGIRPAWIEHLRWLDTQISSVRTLKVSDAGWELVEWDQ